MKVETDLKAGGILRDATHQASEYAGQVSNFVAQANQQASDFTSNLVNTTISLWNCLTNSLR